MEETERIERLEKIKETFEKNGFGINRIPEKTKQWFLEFAETEFLSDRGMALKHLIDFYTGVVGAGTEHIELAIQDIDERLRKLEEKETPRLTRKDAFGRND